MNLKLKLFLLLNLLNISINSQKIDIYTFRYLTFKITNNAFNGNIKEARRLLNRLYKLVPIEAIQNQFKVPGDESHGILHNAIEAKDLVFTRELIKKYKIFVDDNSLRYMITPLHLAAENGDIKIAKFLIENGADVNAKNREGFTPLIYACKSQQKEMVKFLIKNGAIYGLYLVDIAKVERRIISEDTKEFVNWLEKYLEKISPKYNFFEAR